MHYDYYDIWYTQETAIYVVKSHRDKENQKPKTENEKEKRKLNKSFNY